jgi:hypothetical protein
LAVVTFVGANDLVKTESSLTAMWDVVHPKSGSNVCIGAFSLLPNFMNW